MSPLRRLTRERITGDSHILVVGAGAVGAHVAWQLAVLGARRVTLADRGAVAGGATGKALGGIRQQFSTAPEVRLARASLGFFESLGAPLFLQHGYLFVATTAPGMAELADRQRVQASLGVPVVVVDRNAIGRLAPGVALHDVHGGVWCDRDGLADPPAITRAVVQRAAALGVRVCEHADASAIDAIDADVRVYACGAETGPLAQKHGIHIPVRALVRQLTELTATTTPLPRLPMVIEHETGFHFRVRDGRLVLAMGEARPRWDAVEEADAALVPDWLARMTARFPAARALSESRTWAGMYDMTPDAHPIIDRVADDVFVACGFSGHGFMQSPAVGAALAAWILSGDPPADLAPFALNRFAAGAVVPEASIL